MKRTYIEAFGQVAQSQDDLEETKNGINQNTAKRRANQGYYQFS